MNEQVILTEMFLEKILTLENYKPSMCSCAEKKKGKWFLNQIVFSEYTEKKHLNLKTNFAVSRIEIPSNTSWKTLLPLTSTKEKVQFHNRESVPSKHVPHRWHIYFQNNRKAKFDLNTFFQRKSCSTCSVRLIWWKNEKPGMKTIEAQAKV
jgi:hypothetical protein